jgi:exosome complex component CSL4
VRATEVDKVELAACFRPGDLVRAEVASLGDARSYFLATARNELGVVYARSVEGAARKARASHEVVYDVG